MPSLVMKNGTIIVKQNDSILLIGTEHMSVEYMLQEHSQSTVIACFACKARF